MRLRLGEKLSMIGLNRVAIPGFIGETCLLILCYNCGLYNIDKAFLCKEILNQIISKNHKKNENGCFTILGNI